MEAIRCLEDAHEIRPREATISHHLGTAYGLSGMFREAVSYLEFALKDNIYGALLDYIRYTLKLNEGFDVIKFLDENREKFSAEERADLLCQKGSYLIIVERNVIEGLNCYLEAMKVTDKNYLLEVSNRSLITTLILEKNCFHCAERNMFMMYCTYVSTYLPTTYILARILWIITGTKGKLS